MSINEISKKKNYNLTEALDLLGDRAPLLNDVLRDAVSLQPTKVTAEMAAHLSTAMNAVAIWQTFDRIRRVRLTPTTSVDWNHFLFLNFIFFLVFRKV